MRKVVSYINGKTALGEYQNFTNRRKRLRTRGEKQTVYQDISASELSEDELTRSDSSFDSPRKKRRKTLRILSDKAVRETRQTRSRRSRTLISLGNGYREDESDISFSDSSERA